MDSWFSDRPSTLLLLKLMLKEEVHLKIAGGYVHGIEGELQSLVPHFTNVLISLVKTGGIGQNSVQQQVVGGFAVEVCREGDPVLYSPRSIPRLNWVVSPFQAQVTGFAV